VVPRLALVLFFAAGCSLSLDFDGLTGGRDGGGSSEGGSEAGADAPGDAPVDAPPQPFCASLTPAPTFCADFDQSQLVPPFDQAESVNGAPRKDTSIGKSPPASMLAETLAVSAGGRVEAFVHKSFPAFAARALTLDVSADVRVERTDETNGSNAVTLAFLIHLGTRAHNHIDLNAAHDGANVRFELVEHDGTRTEVYALPTRVPKNEWVRLRFQLRLTNPSGTGNGLSVFIGEKQDFNGTLQVPFVTGTPRILVGIPFVGPPSEPWVIRYDNVVADLR
jgi:hypothetical protein